MFTELVTVEMIEDAWIIRINLPQTGNRLNIECMNELTNAFKEADLDPDCRAIILGAWGNDFCTGGDLGDFRKHSSMEIRKFSTAFISLHFTIQSLSKPVIAAVHGATEGGGFTLLEVCDFAVASDDSVFAIPEILHGLAPMMSLTGAARLLPRKRVMELAMLGRSITALEARSVGLINIVCDQDQVMDRAMAIAHEIAERNPTSIHLGKALYRDLINDNYTGNLEKAAMMLVVLLKSEDALETLDARDDGRPPVWKQN